MTISPQVNLTYTTVIHNGVHVLQAPLLIGQGRWLDHITTYCCSYTNRDDGRSTTSFKEETKHISTQGFVINIFGLFDFSLCEGVMQCVFPATD